MEPKDIEIIELAGRVLDLLDFDLAEQLSTILTFCAQEGHLRMCPAIAMPLGCTLQLAHSSVSWSAKASVGIHLAMCCCKCEANAL